jgi:DNA-binding MarR family transcriptional regulator
MGFVLQDRDLKIIRTCYEQTFLTQTLVARYFFFGATRQAASQRVRELSLNGYLLRRVVRGRGRPQVIRLTIKGRRTAEAVCRFEFSKRAPLNMNTLIHDELVTSVRLRLEELWDGKWTPERALKEQSKLRVPDGLIVFDSGKRVAIEVENSLKSIRRLRALLSRWERMDVYFALYVVPDDELRITLERIITNESLEETVCVISYDKLMNEDRPVSWSNQGDAEIFSRRSF